MFDLEGKTAIVTGGGSGIGQAIARLFCRQGARVAILDLDESAAQETARGIGAAGGEAMALRCDVTDARAVEAAFAAAEAKLGPLGILVNNAGIAHVGTIESVSEADFDRVCGVNIKGAYHCAQAAIRRMVGRERGVILNMASITALMGVPERFAYSVTKGAILTMTYSIAVDYVKKGIRCNCICPARVHHCRSSTASSRAAIPARKRRPTERLNGYTNPSAGWENPTRSRRWLFTFAPTRPRS